MCRPLSPVVCLFGAFAAASAMTTQRAQADYAKYENPSPVSANFSCSYGSLVAAAPVYAGVKDLYRVNGEICDAPGGAPGQGSGGCSRMTCTNSSSIWLCNDKPGRLQIPCKYVADNAVELLIQCETAESAVRGQIFSKDATWNVIINESAC